MIFAFHDHFVQFFHIASFERDCSAEHCVEDDSSTPYISFKPRITLFSKNFRSNICRCSTLLMHDIPWLN
jgi:hypothetical protein